MGGRDNSQRSLNVFINEFINDMKKKLQPDKCPYLHIYVIKDIALKTLKTENTILKYQHYASN